MKNKVKRSHNRESQILNSAAKLFAERGYRSTSMRDIASESGMLPGSIYYHYKSKEELLLAVYGLAVENLYNKIESEVSEKNDPWENLEKAIITHTKTILKKDNYALIMVRVLPEEVPSIKSELIELRNRYEGIFKQLIDDLSLIDSVDKKLLRLMLIGAINSTKSWYKRGQYTPEEIGRSFLNYLKISIIK